MADQIPASRQPRLEPISVVWHTFTAPQTLLVLMALVALTLIAAGLIPQAALTGPDESESWLTVDRGPLSRYTDLARAAGLLDLAHTFWFRLLLALLALALVVRAVDAAELAWRATRRKEWPALPALSWAQHAPRAVFTTWLSAEHARQVSAEVLVAEGYGWAQARDNDRSGLVGVSQAYRLWLRPLALAALLVAMAGAWVAATWGWTGEVWQPQPLEIQAVGHDTTGAVRLDAFDMRFDTEGRLVDYRSHITWLRDGSELEAGVAAIGQPARLNGVRLRQLAYVPVARLSAQSSDGRALLIQIPGQASQGREIATVRFLSAGDQPLVFLPQSERFMTLVFEPDCTGNGPAVHLYQIEQGGQERQKVATLLNSGQVPLDDGLLDVELVYVPVLRLDYRPGVNVALAGLGVALATLLAHWLFPARLLWLSTRPGGGDMTEIKYYGWPEPGAERHSRSLAARLAEVLASDD